MLKNPSYAGLYVFGRYQYAKEISPDGKIIKRPKLHTMADWQVKIENHHESYISWEECLKNQELLQKNRTNGQPMILTGSAREGLALLQGLLLCGCCGKRLYPRYAGNGGIYPMYECVWRRREGLSSKTCLNLRCADIDAAIVTRIFDVLKTDQLQIALAALEEIEKRDGSISKQWQMKIDRAGYEAQLAQKRYEEVDPANRLVASTLERRWNDALVKLDQVRESAAQHQQENSLAITAEQKSQILALAQDLPRLWNAATTCPQDRKRNLCLLIKEITVEKVESKCVVAHVRWQGGTTDDVRIILPPSMADRMRYTEETIEAVRQLAMENRDPEIVSMLNKTGQLSSTGKPFTVSMVSWIRFKYKIPAPAPKAGELTVAQVAAKFGVSQNVVYYWIESKHLQARRIGHTGPFRITLDKQTESKLQEWVSNSSRLNKNFSKSSRKKPVGGAK